MQKGTLYLIPVELNEEGFQKSLPSYNHLILSKIKYFIVEELRTARRYIKRSNPAVNFEEIGFFELNEHTPESDISGYLEPAMKGFDIGLLSEAGMPCIADPGNPIVKMAHRHSVKVVPLTGPSSIFMALAASGLNGQNFCFEGYLPVKPEIRNEKIRSIEKDVSATGRTHLFIETPYRNLNLFEAILKICKPGTLLCIACNLTGDDEFILTLPIQEWKQKKPDLHKRPAVFLIGK